MTLRSSSKRENLVLDTSVLAFHGESIHSFDEKNVYIPIEVLEELDKLKIKPDKVGVESRYVNRFLDELRKKGNLSRGIELENGQRIFISFDSNTDLLPYNMTDTNDNKIISVAAHLIKAGQNAKVVSKDISLRVRCDALSIPALDYQKNKDFSSDYMFDEIRTIETTKEKVEKFYDKGFVEIEDENFYPNQGVVIRSGQSSALALADNSTMLRKLYFATGRNFNVEGVIPRSKEQFLALEMLLDPDVDLVSLTGKAGCGKTLLATAAAMKLLHEKAYNRLILSRPIQSTSKDIGYLPGTKEEKMAPWIQPFFDNLEVLYSEKGNGYINLMIERGIIEVESLSYIRGRSLKDTIFIIDEAQNITYHEAKALLTRVGEGSKIVLIGDLEQIDSPIVNQKTSGLSSVASLFKEFEYSGHVKLRKGERGRLATFAAKVM